VHSFVDELVVVPVNTLLAKGLQLEDVQITSSLVLQSLFAFGVGIVFIRLFVMADAEGFTTARDSEKREQGDSGAGGRGGARGGGKLCDPSKTKAKDLPEASEDDKKRLKERIAEFRTRRQELKGSDNRPVDPEDSMEAKALHAEFEDIHFTEERLREHDGSTDTKKRMYLCVCGEIYDVHSSENFDPQKGYGFLWGGRDCTYSMATVSLKPYDSHKFDWGPDELELQQKQALVGWRDHYRKKYHVVGLLDRCLDIDYAWVDEVPVPKKE
jgi:hypothetical protein